MAKQEYDRYLPVPGFEDVLVEVRTIHDGVLMLVYLGLKDDLVNSGICTPQMLEPKERKHERRFDADNEPYCVSRYFVSRGGEPVRRYKVTRRKARATALKLLGAAEAIKKYDEWLRRWERDVELEKAQLIAHGCVQQTRAQDAQRARRNLVFAESARSGNVVFVDWRPG